MCMLVRKETPPTQALHWVYRSLSQTALGMFTSLWNLRASLQKTLKAESSLRTPPGEHEKKKHSASAKQENHAESCSSAVCRLDGEIIFCGLAKLGIDEEGYDRQSSWTKKTNRRKRDGANVHGWYSKRSDLIETDDSSTWWMYYFARSPTCVFLRYFWGEYKTRTPGPLAPYC